MDGTLLLFALVVTLVAGVVKGTTGFAMPMIMISGLGSFLAPELALAGLILPTLAANLWQALRGGVANAVKVAQTHWRYLAVLLTCLFVSAQLVTTLSPSVLFLCLGVPVTTFAILNLLGWRPRVPPSTRRVTEVIVGAIAGFLGGLSGVWGPPTVLYLTALDTPKNEQIQVQGVVYGLGAILLTIAHLRSGILTGPGFTFSLTLLPVALTGVWIGFQLLDRIDQEMFRKMTLAVLVIAGLNLVRRGLMG